MFNKIFHKHEWELVATNDSYHTTYTDTGKTKHWEMRFYKSIQLSPQIDKVEATHLLVKVMENIMHTYSRDIFWLHDRWRLKRNRKQNR